MIFWISFNIIYQYLKILKWFDLLAIASYRGRISLYTAFYHWLPDVIYGWNWKYYHYHIVLVVPEFLKLSEDFQQCIQEWLPLGKGRAWGKDCSYLEGQLRSPWELIHFKPSLSSEVCIVDLFWSMFYMVSYGFCFPLLDTVTQLFSDPAILHIFREAVSNSTCIATLESCAEVFFPGRGSKPDRL